MIVSPKHCSLDCFPSSPALRKSNPMLENFVRCDDDIDHRVNFVATGNSCPERIGITYELKVRLLSRDERHAGQLYRSLPCCSLDSMVRDEEKRAEDFTGLAKHGGISGPLWGHKVGHAQRPANVINHVR